MHLLNVSLNIANSFPASDNATALIDLPHYPSCTFYFSLFCFRYFILSAYDEFCNPVDHQSRHIGKYRLITDSEPEPLLIVHLALDGAHSGEARRAEQVERQEGQSCRRSKGIREIAPDFGTVFRNLCKSVENSESTYYVLLGYQACDRCHCRLPLAPSQRNKDPADRLSDISQDTTVYIQYQTIYKVGSVRCQEYCWTA